MVNDAGLIVWHKLGEDNPEFLEDVIFGKWFEDDCGGYHGESTWIWFASGIFESKEPWIDVTDEKHEWRGFGYEKPTHWCVAPLWGKPE